MPKGAAPSWMPHSRREACRRWLVNLARVGYGARGRLSAGRRAGLNVALGWGGQLAGTRGALRWLLQELAGRAMSGIIACCPGFYALWCFAQSVLDADAQGRAPTALLVRAGQLLSGLAYAGLAFYAAGLSAGGLGAQVAAGDDDAAAQALTGWIMAKPLGRWAVTIAGCVIVALGVAQFVRGWQARFERRLDLQRMGHLRVVLSFVCRVGLIVRGAVIVVAGSLLILAALRFDAWQARGWAGRW